MIKQKNNSSNDNQEYNNITILPREANSCGRCWNEPLYDDKSQTAPRAHEIVTSMPVHLIEKDGNRIILCYVARCPRCGWIKHYGNKFLYKLNGKYQDFNARYWPELVRNMILPSDLEEAVMAVPGDCNILLDARIGLKVPPLTDREKAIWKNYEKIFSSLQYNNN